MVMWFNVEEARNFLLKNLSVYTLRPKTRREGKEVLSYGGFGKKGVVYVVFVKEINDDSELEEFVTESGFNSVEEWLEKAGESRYLYYVMLLPDRM